MKILLADDHELFNDGFSLLLKRLFQDGVIERANSWPAAKKSVNNGYFDLALVDLFMPAPNGWQMELTEFMDTGNVGSVCVLTASLSQDNINHSFALGVQAYIHKSSNFAEICKALQLVMDGKTYLPPQLIAGLETSASVGYYSKLTARQHKILMMIAEGKENRRIASELGIQESTVKRHVYNIFQQLGAGNRTEAVHLARQHGLMQNS